MVSLKCLIRRFLPDLQRSFFNEDRNERMAQLERQAQVAANAVNEALEAKRKKRKLAIEAKKKTRGEEETKEALMVDTSTHDC